MIYWLDQADFGIINKRPRQCWKHKSGSNQPVKESNKMTEANSKVIAPAMQSKKRSNKKLTTTEFIARAKAIHGDKYDYSKVEYVACDQGVLITCKIHGDFTQRPIAHYSIGNGCPKCGKESMGESHRFNTEDAVAKFRSKHGDKYDYSKVEYINSDTKICIICKIHGEFWQQANSHARGIGCPKCAGKKRYTLDEVLEKFKEAHGDKYDYSKVAYSNNKKKVLIICRKHGEFSQVAKSHWLGNGCQKCMGESLGSAQTFSQDEAIQGFISVHGNKYDYSLVEYRTAKSRIKIICREHGVFTQVASAHKAGQGCIHCGNINHRRRSLWVEVCNRPKKKPMLYVIKCTSEGEVFFKVGITCVRLTSRFQKGSSMPYSYSKIRTIYNSAEYVYDLEKQLHRVLKPYQYQPKIPFGGQTECFSHIPKEVIKFLDDLEKTDQLQLIA